MTTILSLRTLLLHTTNKMLRYCNNTPRRINNKRLYARKFCHTQVSRVLTPIRVYLGVFGALLVFLLTDYFLYKPVVVFNGLLGMVAYFNFIDSPDLPHLVVSRNLRTQLLYYTFYYRVSQSFYTQRPF